MKTKEQIIEVLKKRKQDFKFQIFESKEIDRAIEIIQRLVPPDYLASELSEPEKELKLNKTAEEYFKSRLQKPNRDNNYVISADLLHEYMKDFASQFQEQPITDVMLKEKAQKFLNSRMIVDSEYWDYDKTKFVLSDILVKWALSLKAKPIDLKDELIKFLKWYHPSGAQIEPMIDKYLSQYNPSPKAQKGE
jgi:hypothetical protein